VLALKRFGANRVLGVAIVGFSTATLGTGFVQNYHQALACRLILGVFEAGLIPAMVFMISTIWNRRQQAKRVAIIYCATAVSGAFGGLIAYAIQHAGSRHGLESWRWLFIIEGALSMAVGIISFFTLPFSAEKAWFLNVEQTETMRLKRLRDSAYKGDSSLVLPQIKLALTEPLVYLAAIALFSSSIALLGFGTFLPTIVRGMGYTSLQANYLTIPVYIAATISVAAVSWISDRVNKRAIVLACIPLPVLVGYAVALGTAKPGPGYFAMFLCGIGIYPFNCIMLTWIASNLSPDAKRAFGLPLAATLANTAGVTSGQIYPLTDAPRYISGNAVSLAMEACALICVGLIWLLLRRRTVAKQRDLQEGKDGNGQMGDRALDFEYTL
jgi:MFS family permease